MTTINKPATLSEFFEFTYRRHRLWQSPQSTFDNYRAAIKKFSEFLNRPATLDDISGETVSAFIAAHESLGQGPLTINVYAKRLLLFWRFAKEKGLVEGEEVSVVFVDDGRPRPPKPEIRLKNADPPRPVYQCVTSEPIADPSAPMTLLQFFDNVYRPLRLRSRSDTTLRLYHVDMKHFRTFLDRTPMVSDLTSMILSNFLDWFGATPSRTGEKRSPYTVEKARNQFLALGRFAFKKGLLREEPDVQQERLPLRVPRAYTEQQMSKLVQACNDETRTICHVRGSDYWLSLVLVLFDTGERIAPMRAAIWSWLDLDGGWFTVPAEHRKGRTSDRVYKLAPDTLAAIKRMKPAGHKFIWPWPFSDTHIYHHYDRVLKRAGLWARRQKFHAIRRTTASHFEAAGGNATELLDHSKRSVTKKSYLDPRICTPKHAVDLLFRPKVEGGEA